ncbi:MAG: hypothetical protein Q7J79_09145, partial [Gemmatimonadales bacterium]|nr:hypothetical protein [Gemmatimonadales bacterium]
DPKLADCRGCAACVGGKAAFGAERPDHAGQRVVGISGTGTTAALLKDADPMSLLREVRQAEVEQEGPDHDHGSRVVEAVKLALEGATKGPAIVAIAIPMVAFAVPVLDTLIAVVRRAARGAPVFKGDREHLHHRLLDLGLTPAQAAVILYLVCGAFALASMLFLNHNVRGLAVVLTMVGAVVWLSVRHLRLHEFFELARLAQRGFTQTRAIQFNVSVRRAADGLDRVRSWDEIVRILADLFAESEFDGVRLTLRPTNDDGGRREFRLEGGEIVEESVPILVDEWGVHLPFPVGPDGRTKGELAVFRRYGRSALLTDVNLMVEVLRPALGKAAGRVSPPPSA